MKGIKPHEKLLSIIIYRDVGKRTKHIPFVLKLKAEKVSPSFSRKKGKADFSVVDGYDGMGWWVLIMREN